MNLLSLSIIIPTFNSAKTLSACLDSIVSQTYIFFEVWIIDGLSTDTTLTIIQEYNKKYSFIQYVSEKDKGIYDAMNKGIDLAKGEWVYFLGSDDFLFDKYVLQRIFIDRKKIVNENDFIYGNVIWGNSGKIYEGFFDIVKLFQCNICHQAIFYKVSLFASKGNFDLKFSTLADWNFNMKCFFDSSIKKNYIEVIIAYYNTSGLSNIFIDYSFLRYKAHYYNNNIISSGIVNFIKYKTVSQPRKTFLQKALFMTFLAVYLFSNSLCALAKKSFN